MKIAIMGYSGSGKSTLCRILSEKYHLPFLHLDRVQFLAGWQDRPQQEKQDILENFLNTNSGWIIDGNYTRLSYQRRLQEADMIILLLFGRFDCLTRCLKRYRTYRGRNRPDMTEGCNEKFDAEFIRWILWDGRTKAIRKRYQQIQQDFPDKTTVLSNQRELQMFVQGRCGNYGKKTR